MGRYFAKMKDKGKRGKEKEMERAAKDYLKKPYSRVLIPDEDGSYFAEILEFPGCFAEGNSPSEAYENLEKAAESWIEAAIEQGQEIPLPQETHEFSGRYPLRIPRSLHKKAAKFAEKENVSLNQFFLSTIASRLGAEEFYERLAQRIENKIMLTAPTVVILDSSKQYTTTDRLFTTGFSPTSDQMTTPVSSDKQFKEVTH